MNKYDDSFLLAPFREFYAEVIRLKQMIKTGVWVSATEAPAGTSAENFKPETGTWLYFPDIVVGARDETETDTEMRAPAALQHAVPQWAQVKHESNGNNQALDYTEQSPEADY